MHAVFAIEPCALNNWRDFRYITEKFGYARGILIGRYPKRWQRMVLDSCIENNIKGIELQRITEKLHQMKKDRLYPLGLNYNEQDWIENTLQVGVNEKLDAIIVRSRESIEKLHHVDDIDESLFSGYREKEVCRNALELATVATYLLHDAEEIILIDPYFSAENKNVKVLNEMLKVCSAGKNKLKQIVIVTAYSKVNLNIEPLKSSFKNLIEPQSPNELEVNVLLLNDESLDFDFHARYLLTDRAGLRYDRGFVEPIPHDQREHLTEVSCLGNNRYCQLYEDYLIKIDKQKIKAELKFKIENANQI